MNIKIQAGFERLVKDREGQIKLTFQVPLSDEAKAREVPHLTPLTLNIDYEDTGDTRDKQDTGHQYL